jgi:hypothetical protein
MPAAFQTSCFDDYKSRTVHDSDSSESGLVTLFAGRQMMKRSIFLPMAVLIVFGTAQAAVAGPIAPLAPVNELGKIVFAEEGMTVAEAQKDVPSEEMVGIPAYPGSNFVLGEEAGGELISVKLISKDSPEKVVAWYQKNMGKGWHHVPDHTIKELGEVGVFVQADNRNISVNEAMKHKQLRVSKVENPEEWGFAMVFDVSGTKSMIVMTLIP